jgi:hypothetical protein
MNVELTINLNSWRWIEMKEELKDFLPRKEKREAIVETWIRLDANRQSKLIELLTDLGFKRPGKEEKDEV